jgi:anti-sigma-K factor RskA
VNVKEFISSGILESYVLGLCSDADRQEVEYACEHHPEIAAARAHTEEKLEELLLNEQNIPPAALREKILNQLQNDNISSETGTEEYDERPVKNIGIWKWVAAASVILLAGSLFWNMQLRNENRQLRKASVPDTSGQTELAATKAELRQLKDEYSALQRPALKMAALKGWTNSMVRASIFWDTTSKDVFLVVNNLPQPASDKQYQLWAMINKQPVDLGVFDIKQEKLLVKMKNVQQAEAFAITLEPAGGSPRPTMDKMYAYGKL